MKGKPQSITASVRSRLVAAAREAAVNAYAPYSHYRVGAAVFDQNGRIYTGVNVENASYGLTICAERAAVFAAIAAGARHIRAVAIAASRPPAPLPCGACRQVLAEFGEPTTAVYVVQSSGRVRRFRLGELLPQAFLLPQQGQPRKKR